MSHQAAIKTVGLTRRYGKHVAVASLFGQKEQLIEEGTLIFTLGADVLELGNAFRKLVAEFKGDAKVASTDSVYVTKK